MLKSTDGFTLIELMVIVALLAILSAIAVPGLTSLVRDNRIQSQAEEFNALLQYARSEAVIRKIPVMVDVDSSSGQIQVIARNEVIRATSLNLSGLKLETSSEDIGYRSNGTATRLDFRALMCRDSDPETGFLLTVSGSGATALHPRGKKSDGTTLGSCTL